jgi:sulfatase maturation enzyme AslB (radical SAM superfamily)
VLNNPDFDAQKQAISKIKHWVPECNPCRQIEESGSWGSQSPRLASFNKIPDGTIPDNVPGWIELTIDTTCNAACIMCGPWHSTTWRKQEIKFGFRHKDQLPEPVDPEIWFDIIKQRFPLNYVRSVSFMGGEPFQSSIPLIFLENIKKTQGTLANIEIKFSTNGSVPPAPELLSMLSECRGVIFNISLDGVGSRFEYLRYPLTWKKVESNIAYLKTLKIPIVNFQLVCTVNAFNVYYYDELEHWAQLMFSDTRIPMSIKPNKSIGVIALVQTPMSLRHAIFSKFGVTHPVSKLLSNLPVESVIPGINHLDRLDTHRKIFWREVFPDIIWYLNNG